MRSLRGVEGIKVGGENINNIRFADDTVLIADTEEKLQVLLDIVERESERLGLKINIRKTEVMVASKNPEPPVCNIQLQGERIKQSSSFVYLGSLITQDARCNKEVEKRILIAKNAFNNMKTLLTNNNVGIQTRVRALKAYVWSTLTYGSETWTLSTYLKNKIKAAEMWFYRRILRVSWVDRVTNEEILRRVGQGRALLGEIRRRQMEFLGHLIRGEGMEYRCLTGMIEGRRARGRQRKKFVDSILEEMEGEMSAVQLIRTGRCREGWRRVTAHVRDKALR